MPTTFKDGIISKNGVNMGVDVNPSGDPGVASALASQGRGIADPLASVSNTIGSEFTRVTEGIKQNVEDFVQDTGFGKLLRAVNLLDDAMPEAFSFGGDVSFGSSGGEPDWRVKLSLPSTFKSSNVLAPLLKTGGMVWPYTPQIYVTHSAGYTPIKPVHSNYPFFAYQNSQVDSFSITGDFTVENSLEGQYWLGAVHYLRSVTKMAYGKTDHQGAPPPVVRLNGYGDYVFKNVPVIVQSFSVELNQDVDYIKVDVGPNGSYVPTRSNIQVTVQPIYSRRAVETFSLRNFVNGNYVARGGFI